MPFHSILAPRLALAVLFLALAPVLLPGALATPATAAPPVVFPADAELPRVLAGAEGRHLLGTGDTLYAASLVGRDAQRYYLVRPGVALRAPASSRPLGRGTLILGEARVINRGEPATLRIERARREIRPGDYLLAMEPAGLPDGH